MYNDLENFKQTSMCFLCEWPVLDYLSLWPASTDLSEDPMPSPKADYVSML